ncbi:MAG: tRNA (adenosine(37)-N6)-threonylcarbamoyltransferase complex ATPase subunit type 1 TsaE [bacterium]
MKFTYTSNNPKKTKKIASLLASLLPKGSVLALIGELGSGKTTFIKGLAEGLKVKGARYVTSPTFILVNEYKGEIPLYHFDVYRLESQDEFFALGFEEYVYGNGVTAIEWADKVEDSLPNDYLEIKFKAIVKKNQREIEFISHGERYKELIENLMRKIQL